MWNYSKSRGWNIPQGLNFSPEMVYDAPDSYIHISWYISPTETNKLAKKSEQKEMAKKMKSLE